MNASFRPMFHKRYLIILLLLLAFYLVSCGSKGTTTEVASRAVSASTEIPPAEPTTTATIPPVYLADLQPFAAQIQISGLGVGRYPFYIGGEIFEGEPILRSGKFYSKGLFAHAPSVLGWSLSGQYESFQSDVFVLSTPNCGDGVQFEVLLDGRQAGFVQSTQSGLVQTISLDVRGVETLILRTRANQNPDCDWAVWGDPNLRPAVSLQSATAAPSAWLELQAGLPCEQAADNRQYVYMDCNDIRRIRREISAGNPDALVHFLMLEEIFRDPYPYQIPDEQNLTLEEFMPYIFSGYDYPPRQAALLWLITGQPHYAEITKTLLERAAQLPVSTRWEDSAYGLIIPIETGGEVYQSLFFAYTTLRDTAWITEEERDHLDDFFIEHARVMQRWSGWTDGVWNPGIRADATMMMIAKVMKDDPRAAGIRQTAQASLDDRIRDWFDDDGGYIEYSDNYSAYILESLLLYAETEFKQGNDLYSNEWGGATLNEMCRWVLAEITPQGTLPGMNDGWFTSIDPGLLLLCGKRTGDAELIFAARQLQMGQIRTIPRATYFHQLAWVDETLTPEKPLFNSTILPQSGLAILRSGWEEADQYFLLQFTPSTHHQHYHTGSIVLHDEIPWLIDNGYPAASDEENERALSSKDHSTITLNDQNHNYTGGEPLAFYDLGGSGYMSVSLKTYPSLKWVRSVFWLKPLHQWVILDHADSRGKQELALRWYVQGDLKRLAPLDWQFKQKDATLSIKLFSSLEMQDIPASRIYKWGDLPAYGSSAGMEASALVSEWPIQISSLMTTRQMEGAELLPAQGGHLIQTIFETGEQSRVWMAFPESKEIRQDGNNFMTGSAGCTLWDGDRLIAYCLYAGSELRENNMPLISATSPVSVHVDLAGGTIALNCLDSGSLTLYWPEQVLALQDAQGNPVSFTWQASQLLIDHTTGGQVFYIIQP